MFDHIKNSLLLFINKIKLILKINDAIKNMHKEKKKNIRSKTSLSSFFIPWNAIVSFHHKWYTVRKLHFFKSFGLSVSYSSSSSRTHHYRVSTKICAIVHPSPMSYLHCDHVQPCANAVVTKKISTTAAGHTGELVYFANCLDGKSINCTDTLSGGE